MDGLTELANKWKLRAPWAVVALFAFDLMDVLKAQDKKVPYEVHIPLVALESIYPWAPPLPALEIKIPAWAFFLRGREELQAEIGKKLKNYESELKATGAEEYPSALEVHAKWWFEHYVHIKKYVELESEFASASQESIKRAVWKFTKLVTIKIN